jgi:ribonuclease G
MEEKKNRQKILQAVEQELKKDRSPSKALQVSDFGLVIITRKRVKQSHERVLTEPCPYCSGTGVIKSSSTICYEILSEVKKVGPELNGHRLLLRVNPDIARALKEEESAVLQDLRQTTGKDVTVKPDVHLHHEQFDLTEPSNQSHPPVRLHPLDLPDVLTPPADATGSDFLRD